MRTIVAEVPEPSRRQTAPNQGRFLRLPPDQEKRWLILTRDTVPTAAGQTALGSELGSIIGDLQEPVLDWQTVNSRTPHVNLPPEATPAFDPDKDAWQPPPNEILTRLRRGLDKL